MNCVHVNLTFLLTYRCCDHVMLQGNATDSDYDYYYDYDEDSDGSDYYYDEDDDSDGSYYYDYDYDSDGVEDGKEKHEGKDTADDVSTPVTAPSTIVSSAKPGPGAFPASKYMHTLSDLCCCFTHTCDHYAEASCVDKQPKCSIWASWHPSECDKNPTYMHRECPFSCKRCTKMSNGH